MFTAAERDVIKKYICKSGTLKCVPTNFAVSGKGTSFIFRRGSVLKSRFICRFGFKSHISCAPCRQRVTKVSLYVYVSLSRMGDFRKY